MNLAQDNYLYNLAQAAGFNHMEIMYNQEKLEKLCTLAIEEHAKQYYDALIKAFS